MKKYSMSEVKEEKNILHNIKTRKANWICHILHRNCLSNILLKERHKGWEDEEEDVSSYWMTLRKEQILEHERGSTRTWSVEKLLWKRLLASHKADYVMNE